MYTINSGKNNSSTFVLFLIKLSEHLNNVDANWRETTIIMIDNAPYHRSKSIMEKY